ncbi:MAG: M60 family metallopeptidase [Oscillospiraceae bacterium]|nr:M60 family metallopeptidase [Oscillospiraceae bacterium]
MRIRTRVLSLLLTAALLLSSLSWASLARAEEADGVTGSISATLRVDYAQRLDALRDRQVQAELLRDGRSLGVLPLWEADSGLDAGGYAAEVSLRNPEGGDLGGGQWPGYLDLTVKDLPRGSYSLRFTGRGYVTCTVDLALEDCARYAILGTGDATFTLGDVDGSGQVDKADREALAAALGSEKDADLERFDLDGDGTIDIVDLAYVDRQLEAQGEAECLKTALLDPPVDVDGLAAKLAAAGTAVTGDLENLFLDNGETVRLAGENIQLEMDLDRTVDLQQVQIVSPSGAGEVQKGVVLAVDESGKEHRVPFDTTPPEDTQATGRTPGSGVILVNLGTRVPVKRIAITVSKTQGGEYAALEAIQFLQDIVPENPAPKNSAIKQESLTAEAGSELVQLRWDALPNVSGYKILFWPEEEPQEVEELRVDVTRAEVTGLDNGTTYAFTVTPTDGSWEGKPSAAVTATPQPSGPPDRVDMVRVSVLDGALGLSWKEAKGANYYIVEYRPAAGEQWQSWEGQLAQTSTVVTGLTNDVTYALRVTAGNDQGLGSPSAAVEGTPKATNYDPPEGLPTEALLDRSLIEKVELADPKNYLASAYPEGFNINNVIDGDYRTHWTASNNWSGNEHVIATFKEPVDLSAVIWVPRLDGSFPSYLRAYSVRVWYADGTEELLVPDPALGGVDNGGTGADVHTWPTIPNQSTIPTDRFAIMPFDPVKGVKKISVAAEQVGYDGHNVSLSELMFVQYDPSKNLTDDIAGLFAGGKDGLHTQLAEGVDEARIKALEDRLDSGERLYYFHTDIMADELALARELLSGGKSSGAVLEGIESRSGGRGSSFQPLGVTVRAGQTIVIYAAGIPENGSVDVYATQYGAEASSWQSKIGTLHNGRNLLTIPQLTDRAEFTKGGSLYATYGGTGADQIKLHVHRAGQAVSIPVLDLGNWYTLDEAGRKEVIGRYVDELDAYLTRSIPNPTTNYLNVTEIATPSVLLSIPALTVQSAMGSSSREEKIQTLYNSIEAWEQVMAICRTTHGIDAVYEKVGVEARQNIRYMTMFSGAFMYAAGSHIGIGYSSCGGMVTGRPVKEAVTGDYNGLFGWGIAHEIGHNLDLLGKAEITNNIYSLMVQTYDGKSNTLPSRLEKSGKYAAIFDKTAQGMPGASGDVFVQLGMYWQLHLAYDGGEKLPKFFNDFSKAWSQKTYFTDSNTYDERVALTASGVAGKDLSEFFTRWGMVLSDEAKAKMPAEKETRAIWYLNDQSRRDRLANVTAPTGEFSAAAANENGGKEVTVTITPLENEDYVQGYEILRNGKPIAFIQKGTAEYKDTIGSGNHRVYTYEVTAYDTLGNKIGETVKAGEVRVAYDMLVDEKDYKVSREADGTVTITVEKGTDVTGIKTSAGGDLQATIEIGEKRYENILSAPLEERAVGFVGYFRKPDTAENDTRIWTYEPEKITLTGVPKDAEIKLISFAGDDISFLEGATMGALSADYTYQTQEGTETIEAGTLVILGTYRGDPVYNTINIKGEFITAPVNDEADSVPEPVVRPLDGYALLLATVPETGPVSDISDGFFIFVPNLENEAALQAKDPCEGLQLLPGRIQAELKRTDKHDSAESQRVTAQTAWINCPGDKESLPQVVLQTGGQE